jgi:hypothetical protein
MVVIKNKHDPEVTLDLWNLLLILLLSLVAASSIAAYLVVHYSPSGTHLTASMLLNPEVLEKLNVPDSNISNGKANRFVFSHIVFETFQAGHFKQAIVSLDDYRLFYGKIDHDESLDRGESLQHIFDRGALSTLTLWIKADEKGVEKSLQRLEIAGDGDHYRVELLANDQKKSWAFFYHPGIKNEAEKIFIRDPGKGSSGDS